MGPVADFRQSRGHLVPFADVGRARWWGEDAARDTLGPGWREFAGRLGSLVDGSGASGRRWQGSQPSEGATELGFPGPALGKMQSEAARLAGEPAGQREEASSECLGGYNLLAQTDARCPAGQVMGHHPVSSTGQALDGQPSGVGGEAPRGRWLRPTPYLRSLMAFSISAWRRWSASSSRVSPSRSVMKP